MYTYRSDILKRVSESKGVSSSSVDLRGRQLLFALSSPPVLLCFSFLWSHVFELEPQFSQRVRAAGAQRDLGSTHRLLRCGAGGGWEGEGQDDAEDGFRL